MARFCKQLIIALGKFALLILNAVYYSWIISVFWAWFVVPLGAPEIGMAHAYGLSCLVSMPLLGIALGSNQLLKETGFWTLLLTAAFVETVALGMALFVRVLM